MKPEEESEQGGQLVIPVPEVSPQRAPKSPEDSRKLIQKQLVLLLHAHACQKKDVGCSMENRLKCPVSNCEMMKNVWEHIKGCKVGPDCSHLHCSSSLKILAHWKHCTVWECPVCHLVRLKGGQSKPLAFAQVSGGPASDQEASGQSTKPVLQGQSQCQGQQLPQQQMKPGSELNGGGYCYCHCSSRGNTCHVDISHPYQQQSPYQLQSNQDIPNPLFNQFHPPHLPISINSHDHKTNGSDGGYPGNNILPYGLVPTSGMGEGVGNFSNRRLCQCVKCIDHPQDLEPGSYQMSSYPLNTGDIGIPREIRNRKRSADPFEMEFHMTSRYKPNEAPAPSANDVRRAYEQLGIPCPSDALKRLMATLPGGSKVIPEEDEGVPDNQTDSLDEDDGINVEYIAQDDVPPSSWCLSLVERLMTNGHQITAGSS